MGAAASVLVFLSISPGFLDVGGDQALRFVHSTDSSCCHCLLFQVGRLEVFAS